jgi:predicted flavoprotein YhiN
MLLGAAGIGRETTLAELGRAERRRLLHALLELPLAASDSRGYGYAEVTAGGVDVAGIDPATMESRTRTGLYLVGEILDVDGRIGGFNFQWAWSSAYVAARALASRLGERPHLGSRRPWSEPCP